MKLVVGLGNPGSRYAETRHNVGFMTAAKLVPMLAAAGAKKRFDAEVVEGQIDGEKVVVMCPLTFMNASGQSVRKAVDFYKLAPAEMLVVCDDMNLPLAQLRLRGKGSSGGQKGLADIIRHLGTELVPRLRIGIDPPPPGWAVPDYVLSKFRRGEQGEIDKATELAALAAVDWALHGLEHSMSRYNVKNPTS